MNDSLGLSEKEVDLLDYTKSWADTFLEKKIKLIEVLNLDTEYIEHVGSTAIPGIKAKPIIDIAIGISDFADLKIYIEALSQQLHFLHKGECGVAGRHFFVLHNENSLSTCHLHLVLYQSVQWFDLILFRDYLVGHPEAAIRYESIKVGLQKKHKTDRKKYTKQKDPIIKQLLKEAREFYDI